MSYLSEKNSAVTLKRGLLILLLLCMAACAPRQKKPAIRFFQSPIPLGEEYTEYERSNAGAAAKQPGKPKKLHSITRSVLLYVPNRLADLLDIVRVDAGVGPAFGAVVRVTKWGQAGYRDLSPLSLRVGLRGRKLPVFLERSNEFGVGPAFLQSSEREVTPVEIGAGADLFFAGAYFGISLDEALDFLLGFVGIDIHDDDW